MYMYLAVILITHTQMLLLSEQCVHLNFHQSYHLRCSCFAPQKYMNEIKTL